MRPHTHHVISTLVRSGTVTPYGRDPRHLVAYLKRKGVRLHTDAMGVNEARGFIQRLSKAGLSPSSVSPVLEPGARLVTRHDPEVVYV